MARKNDIMRTILKFLEENNASSSEINEVKEYFGGCNEDIADAEAYLFASEGYSNLFDAMGFKGSIILFSPPDVIKDNFIDIFGSAGYITTTYREEGAYSKETPIAFTMNGYFITIGEN